MKPLPGIMLMFLSLALAAPARTWTSASGKQLEAEYVSQAYGKVTLKSPQGELFSIPLNKLSPADQEYLRTRGLPPPRTGKAAAAAPAAPRAADPATTARLVPGQTFTRTAEGETAVPYHVRVPPAFDPAAPPPLLIAFSAGGKGRFMADTIGPCADKLGWITIGCDKLKNDLPDGKLTDQMEDEVLEDIYRNIPHDPRRVYLAGHSGGAMRAYGLTARRKESFAGILAYGGWLGGPDYQKKLYGRHMAVAMVNGDKDDAANAWVQGDTQALKYRKCNVKVFEFPGGHPMPTAPEPTDQALRWLQEDWEKHGAKRPDVRNRN